MTSELEVCGGASPVCVLALRNLIKLWREPTAWEGECVRHRGAQGVGICHPHPALLSLTDDVHSGDHPTVLVLFVRHQLACMTWQSLNIKVGILQTLAAMDTLLDLSLMTCSLTPLHFTVMRTEHHQLLYCSRSPWRTLPQ